MFKSNPFAGITPFRGSNGSVPSIGGVPTLQAALAAVDRAEAQLEAARSAARAAAKREGKSVSGLFEDSKYILRASGERWADAAREEGVETGCDLVVRGLRMSEDPPFQHIAKRLKRNQAEGVQQVDLARHWAALDAAGFLTAARAGDYEEAARIAVEVHREEAGKVTGERILAAGRRARMDGSHERPLPEKGTFAERVLAAGRKARNED
jgi:hypothetical protein